MLAHMAEVKAYIKTGDISVWYGVDLTAVRQQSKSWYSLFIIIVFMVNDSLAQEMRISTNFWIKCHIATQMEDYILHITENSHAA